MFEAPAPVRDFVAPVRCSPNSLLVVLLWPLLIGVNHLFPLSAVNLAWLLDISSSGLPSASGLPKGTVVSELLILSLSLSMPVVSASST